MPKTLQNTLPKTVKRDFTPIYQGIRACDHARTTGLAESYILVGFNLKNKVFLFSRYFSDSTSPDVRYTAHNGSLLEALSTTTLGNTILIFNFYFWN